MKVRTWQVIFNASILAFSSSGLLLMIESAVRLTTGVESKVSACCGLRLDEREIRLSNV